jgi:hypothetical protein
MPCLPFFSFFPFGSVLGGIKVHHCGHICNLHSLGRLGVPGYLRRDFWVLVWYFFFLRERVRERQICPGGGGKGLGLDYDPGIRSTIIRLYMRFIMGNSVYGYLISSSYRVVFS